MAPTAVMTWLALEIYVVGVIFLLGVRSWMHYRATGDSGHRHTRPRIGTIAWWAQLFMVLALVLGLLAPLLAGTGLVPSWAVLDRLVVDVVGLLIAVAGFTGALLAQQAMGRSWRIGVDPTERTRLVTTGVFALVRNPIFTAMIVAMVGLTLMVPSWPQVLALACLIAGLELQVRYVEEPHLAQTHGADYTAYAATTGRFVPRAGRRIRAVLPVTGPQRRRPQQR